MHTLRRRKPFVIDAALTMAPFPSPECFFRMYRNTPPSANIANSSTPVDTRDTPRDSSFLVPPSDDAAASCSDPASDSADVSTGGAFTSDDWSK